jgi:hypothetical protein
MCKYAEIKTININVYASHVYFNIHISNVVVQCINTTNGGNLYLTICRIIQYKELRKRFHIVISNVIDGDCVVLTDGSYDIIPYRSSCCQSFC